MRDATYLFLWRLCVLIGPGIQCVQDWQKLPACLGKRILHLRGNHRIHFPMDNAVRLKRAQVLRQISFGDVHLAWLRRRQRETAQT